MTEYKKLSSFPKHLQVPRTTLHRLAFARSQRNKTARSPSLRASLILRIFPTKAAAMQRITKIAAANAEITSARATKFAFINFHFLMKVAELVQREDNFQNCF